MQIMFYIQELKCTKLRNYKATKYMKRQQTCRILAVHHNFRDPCCSSKNIKNKGNLLIYLI